MMASGGMIQAAMLLLAAQLVLCRGGAADVDRETGTVIPAESRPCVDCHAFEFMQRALQDLKKTAFNLDARVHTLPRECVECKNGDRSWAKMEKTETLVLRAERRAFCDCMPSSLR